MRKSTLRIVKEQTPTHFLNLLQAAPVSWHLDFYQFLDSEKLNK